MVGDGGGVRVSQTRVFGRLIAEYFVGDRGLEDERGGDTGKFDDLIVDADSSLERLGRRLCAAGIAERFATGLESCGVDA